MGLLLFMPVTRVLERHWVLRPLCIRRVSGKRLVSLIDRLGSGAPIQRFKQQAFDNDRRGQLG